MKPHDRPTAGELIESVREWLERDVLAATDGRLHYHARVAINALSIVERELVVGPDQQAAHIDRLQLLGFANDAELASAIRSGDLDDRMLKDIGVSRIDLEQAIALGHGALEMIDAGVTRIGATATATTCLMNACAVMDSPRGVMRRCNGPFCRRPRSVDLRETCSTCATRPARWSECRRRSRSGFSDARSERRA